MLMRIDVPNDVRATTKLPSQLGPDSAPLQEQIISFLFFAMNVWLDDPRCIAAGIEQQKHWPKVIEIFEKHAHAGGRIYLEKQDYDTIKVVVLTPRIIFVPPVTLQCLSFSIAFLNAVEVDPNELDVMKQPRAGN